MTEEQKSKIPKELRDLAQWQVYKLTDRGNGKKGKPPVSPTTGKEISWNTPKNFLTFDQAVSALRENRPGNLAGIGLVFTGKEPLSGIDIDSCLTEAGEPLPEIRPILERISTYTEVSPSGKGLRIIGRGKLPDHDHGGKSDRFEVYSSGRFLTITGNVYQARAKIEDFGDSLAWFRQTYAKAPPKPAGTVSIPPAPASPSAPIGAGYLRTPEEVIRVAGLAKTGDKFKSLMDGDTSLHGGDHSAADMALMLILAFYCGKDPGLMEATFNLSGLANREKWKTRADYRERTIQKAIENTRETFKPSTKATEGGDYSFSPDRESTGRPKELPKLHTKSAADLQKKVFADPKWAVPGLLPEGLTVLAGRPKKGKSWMALGLALAAASGGKAFGMTDVEQGKVLYLALEDSERRMQNRIAQLLGPCENFPPNLHYIAAGEFPRTGGIEALQEWIKDNPDTRLVIIDTIAKIKPMKRSGGDAYQEDYAFNGLFQTMAIAHNVAVLVLTHTKKSTEAEDVFDRITGTTGNTSAADALWVIQTGKDGRAVLHVTGRDIEQKNLAMKFDNGTWTCTGEATDEDFLSPSRKKIIDLLLEKGPLNPAKISELLSMPKNSVYQFLSEMKKTEQVLQDGDRGKYYVLPKETKETKETL